VSTKRDLPTTPDSSSQFRSSTDNLVGLLFIVNNSMDIPPTILTSVAAIAVAICGYVVKAVDGRIAKLESCLMDKDDLANQLAPMKVEIESLIENITDLRLDMRDLRKEVSNLPHKRTQ
jgi:hypothetical protein